MTSQTSTTVAQTPATKRPEGRRSVRAALWPAGRLALILAYLAGTLVVAHGSQYTQNLILTAAIFAILAASLDLVAGMTGLYSLGHAALFAFAAYGTAILNANDGVSIWLLLPMCVVGVGLVGLVIGALALRVSGLYFAVTTFVLTLVVSTIAGQLNFTGGPQGIIGPLFPEFSASLTGTLGASLVWCVMLALLLTVVLIWCIRRSPLYPVLLAVRDAEPFAAAVGVRTPLVKVGVIAFSASLCGLAGWGFSFLGVVSPGQFSWSVTVNILVMVLLGGINTTLGPLIGAAIISIYPAYVNFSPLWQECLIAAVFVIVVVIAPEGIVGVFKKLVNALPGVRVGPQLTATLPSEGLAERAEERDAPAEPRRQLEGWKVAPAHAGELAVECRDVKFAYVRGVTVLDGVDFAVRRGTIHGLIGPNGSGKSTLVSVIAGANRPISGTVELHGSRVERVGPAARARHGVMRTFQSAVLVDELSAGENVTLGLYTKVSRIALRSPIWPALPRARRQHRWMREQSAEALDWVGARAWARVQTGRAPHGIQQLTQLAAASVAKPDLLILDEPFAGLTAGEVENLSSLLRELREAGVTVILIEHQTRVVFSLCDEVTVLNAGEVVATGSASEVFEHQRVREVYLGL